MATTAFFYLFFVPRQCREARVCVLLFWTSLGSLVMGGIGLYSLGYSPEDREIFREGREVTHSPPAGGNTTNTGDTLNNPLKFPNRMFDGVNEWLVGSLISLLGIFATAMVIKVSHSSSPSCSSSLQYYRRCSTWSLAERRL